MNIKAPSILSTSLFLSPFSFLHPPFSIIYSLSFILHFPSSGFFLVFQFFSVIDIPSLLIFFFQIIQHYPRLFMFPHAFFSFLHHMYTSYQWFFPDFYPMKSGIFRRPFFGVKTDPQCPQSTILGEPSVLEPSIIIPSPPIAEWHLLSKHLKDSR